MGKKRVGNFLLLIVVCCLLAGNVAEAKVVKYFGEVYYGDYLEPVYARGNKYGCFFKGKPESKRLDRAIILESSVGKATVKIPKYLWYNKKRFKVTEVFEMVDYDSSVSYIFRGFWNRNKIKRLIIPETVENLKLETSLWKNLKSFNIPAKVRWLELDYTKAKVTLSPGNKWYRMKDGAIYSRETGNLYVMTGKRKTCRVEESAKSITDKAFKNDIYIRKVTIPDSVEDVYESCFEGCKALTEVYFEHTEKMPKLWKNVFLKAKKGITFYVKNEEMKEQLKKNLKRTKARKYKIKYW